MNRPGWDEYFLNIAQDVSLRGSCVRKQVGCVLVDREHNIIATGYNGKAAGSVNCIDKPCAGATEDSGMGLESCEAIHAEQNALMRCRDIREIDTVYVTCSPCVFCVNLLTATGARRVVFLVRYPHDEEAQRRWVGSRAEREWKCFGE